MQGATRTSGGVSFLMRRMHPYALYKSRVGLSRSPMQKKAAKGEYSPHAGMCVNCWYLLDSTNIKETQSSGRHVCKWYGGSPVWAVPVTLGGLGVDTGQTMRELS